MDLLIDVDGELFRITDYEDNTDIGIDLYDYKNMYVTSIPNESVPEPEDDEATNNVRNLIRISR